MEINISINTNKNPSGKTPSSVSNEIPQDKNQLPLTSLEIGLNRFFTILLFLSSLLLLLNIITLPTVLTFIIFALFLWFGKKYHFFANILFLMIALGIYFIPIPPIGWGLFRTLKEFRLAGFNFNFGSLFFIPVLVFISLSVRNFLGNIFAFFKVSTSLRNALYFISVFIIFIALLAYPFFGSVKLRDQAILSNGTGELSTVVLRQTLTFIDSNNKEDGFMARFDPSVNKYIYRLQLSKPLSQDINFLKVETDGKKINFITDDRVTCLNCQKSKEEPSTLIFPANQDIDFIVASDQIIRTIYFTEPGGKVAEFIFWE
jgi:hypothetical protein